MAITVTPKLTTIYDGETTSGWSGGGQNTTDMVEGTACLADNNQSEVTSFMYDYQTENGTTLDLTSTTLYS